MRQARLRAVRLTFQPGHCRARITRLYECTAIVCPPALHTQGMHFVNLAVRCLVGLCHIIEKVGSAIAVRHRLVLLENIVKKGKFASFQRLQGLQSFWPSKSYIAPATMSPDGLRVQAGVPGCSGQLWPAVVWCCSLTRISMISDWSRLPSAKTCERRVNVAT